MGEIGEHPATGSFRTKDGASSSLLKRKEQKRVKKKMMKKREKKREKIKNKIKKERRERERAESESELAGSTWTRGRIMCVPLGHSIAR
jgi:UDP-N-acetylenolpyruvoylglucosamine reductase